MQLSSRRRTNSDPPRFGDSGSLKKLLAASARATSLGIAVLDSQSRFELINASLARENGIAPSNHIGRTAYELVGDLVLPMEKVYERVLSLGEPESLLIKGRVRNTPEFGSWLNHCFPIKDCSGRVRQIGVFAVNVTAEKAAGEIFDTLATHPRLLMAEAAGLLDKFHESIRHYHCSLQASFAELACPFTETPRKVDRFRSSVMRLDEEISLMRELIYAVIAHFPMSEC
jgi:hypothetical protein